MTERTGNFSHIPSPTVESGKTSEVRYEDIDSFHQHGGGHNAAGNAMIDALAELGVRAEMVDSLAIASEWGSKTVSGVYASVARHSPRVFGAGYRVVGKLSPKHGIPPATR